MQETYTGYPNLERVCFSRKDPRLKPTRCLRFWYLTQALPVTVVSEDAEGNPLPKPRTVRIVAKEALIERWSRATGNKPESCDRILREGMGVFWERAGDRIRIREPRELHEELGERQEWQPRPVMGLVGSSKEFHRHVVESHVLTFRRGTDGITEPVTRKQLAESCGMSRMAVIMHLRSSKKVEAIPQLMKVEGKQGEPEDYRARFPHAFCRYVKGLKGLWRRLPDRFRVRDHMETHLGWRTTWLGWVMRIGLICPLGLMEKQLVQLWDNLQWPNYVREVV